MDISRDVGDFSSVVGVVGGSYYYAGHGSGTYIHILENLDKAAPEIENFVGTSAAWSPDGKSIAFKRSHAGGLATDFDLVVHSIETGDEHTYLTKLATTGNGAPIWSQDGKSIVTGIKLNGSSQPTRHRIDLKTGDFKELPQGVLSPEDRTVYAVRPDPARQGSSRIVSQNLETGEERPIYAFPDKARGNVAVSPDGRALAFNWFPKETSTTLLAYPSMAAIFESCPYWRIPNTVP